MEYEIYIFTLKDGKLWFLQLSLILSLKLFVTVKLYFIISCIIVTLHWFLNWGNKLWRIVILFFINKERSCYFLQVDFNYGSIV